MEVLNDRPDLKKMIETVAKKQNFQNYEITEIQTNQKGEGFLGQIFMVTISDSSKEFNFVVKSAFKEESVRKLAPIRNSFLNEIYVYTSVQEAFRKFEIENNVAPFKFFPECYEVSQEENAEMLCLENLKVLKFELFDKRQFLDDDHVSLIFQFYGRFHAYSFAMKEKKPEDYREIVGNLYNLYIEMMKNTEGGFVKYLKYLSDLIDEFFEPGKDDLLKKKFEKYLGEGIVNEFLESVERTEDFFTILHGDCWSNNMMFKYEEHDNQKKVSNMRFLDLQIAKEGSPVCDLSYCLYSGASNAVYTNLEKYLKIYHKSLSDCLESFGCDSEKLYPYRILKDHWKRYSRFGMIMAVAIIKMKCTDQKDIKDFTDFQDGNTDAAFEIEYDEKDYKKRVMELLYHMDEIDAL